MNIQEIVERAIDGDSILFLGAGFACGAKNFTNEGTFPIANALCDVLIREGEIDVEGEDEKDLHDLQYISSRFLENNTKRDLLRLLKDNYGCKCVSEEHEIIADIPWKKIYTTNYDDVMEVASKNVGRNREPAIATNKIGDIYNRQNAIIHINGYINNVNEDDLDSTFKLTSESYLKRTIYESDWAVALNTDIKNAKSVIFIGYSLEYDIEIQQIFASDNTLKDKCIFVTLNPTRRQENLMSKFGIVFKDGLCKYSELIKTIMHDYKPQIRKYEMKCLEEVNLPDNLATSVKSDDIIRLFIDGEMRSNLIFSSEKYKYFFRRLCVEQVKNFLLGDGKVAIIHSDLANGKSVILHQIESELIEYVSLYKFTEKFDISMADDIEYIASTKGLHIIEIENYNQLLDNEIWDIIKKYQYSNIKYIFTSRSYINDNFYGRVCKDLKLSSETFGMYDINVLCDEEVINFENLISEYSLWGIKFTKNRNKRINFIKKDCKSEIRNVLLELYKSPNVISKINEIVKMISLNEKSKNVLLYTFITNILSIRAEISDMYYVLGADNISSLFLDEYSDLYNFVFINRNQIRLKSSIIASHIIKNGNYNQDILNIINLMVNKFSRSSYITKYSIILRYLISFSNLRLIFNTNDSNIKDIYIEFYENSRKTDYYKDNPFFWVQYAIAVMDINDYSAAQIYLENASALVTKKYSEDSYQVDSLRARLLLEKTLFDKNEKDAYDNFEKAHDLICSNKTPERHYPYRQVNHYIDYYQVFYAGFSEEQKVSFMFKCTEIQKRINDYLEHDNLYERNKRKRNVPLIKINNQLKKIINNMANG